MVSLFNTLSGKKEEFVSLEKGKVRMYSCGPTVYNFAHIGNFRSFLTSDLLARVLKYAGYKVTKVMNITDVGHLTGDDAADATGEDKIEKMAKAEKVDPFAIARKYEDAFFEDETVLRILPADHSPRATDFIAEQIDMTEKLISEGYAYETNGSVYFRTTKFEKYGQLSKNKLEDLRAGARVEINSEKENPLDFALWKKAEENHLMQWDSPWGRGFPGWHIECSAMSKKLLGFPFDIHTGGEDNVFPHHECEIAQNECSNNGKKSVNYWIHTKYLLVGGKKMAKSAGNFYTIRDLLEKGWNGNEIRLALLSAHYRSTLDFSMKSLEQARAFIKRIQNVLMYCKSKVEALDFDGDPSNKLEEFRNKYKKALFDDLNVSEALAQVASVIRYFYGDSTRKNNLHLNKELILFLENDFDSIFDCLTTIDKKQQILLSEKIKPYLIMRLEARKDKKWDVSDKIRDFLLKEFDVEIKDEVDTKERPIIRWQAKNGSGTGFQQG